MGNGQFDILNFDKRKLMIREKLYMQYVEMRQTHKVSKGHLEALRLLISSIQT